jgi:divalent metal cation (Fe/Co/Zn/Cd) transporter
VWGMRPPASRTRPGRRSAGSSIRSRSIGFLGNEAVAIFRIRVGRQIGSAALVADGYHARVDGWTSLAVLVGALAVWAGYPLADPLVGLLIAAAIFVLVWQSARSIVLRMLDGVHVDPYGQGGERHHRIEAHPHDGLPPHSHEN